MDQTYMTRQAFIQMELSNTRNRYKRGGGVGIDPLPLLRSVTGERQQTGVKCFNTRKKQWPLMQGICLFWVCSMRAVHVLVRKAMLSWFLKYNSNCICGIIIPQRIMHLWLQSHNV